MPILSQARYYLQRLSENRAEKAMKSAVNSTADAMEKHAPDVLPTVIDESVQDETVATTLKSAATIANRQLQLIFDDEVWNINIELSSEQSENNWLSVSESANENERSLSIRIGMESPFMRRMVSRDDSSQLEIVVRLAAGIALSEHFARAGGVKRAGVVRRNLNRLMSDAFSLRN